jgi:serine/threonine-protein kinase
MGDPIGAGGMGSVYRATDMRSGVTVALKLVHPHLQQDRAFVERFHREAHIASLLTSPYVVRLLDFGQERGRYFMVSEFVEGTRLTDILKRGRMEPLQALAIAVQVALALGEAEARGVIHRDIKPDNIIITPDLFVKVLDFGIARQIGVHGVTMTGVFVGTVAYAAPEQFRGESDIRSDIYSLGVTMFQMLAGDVPFRAPSPTDVIRMHEQEPPPIERLAGVPPALVDVVSRCLAKSPEDRYQHVSDLLGAIEDARSALTGGQTDSWIYDATAVLASTGTEASAPPTGAAAPSVAESSEQTPVAMTEATRPAASPRASSGGGALEARRPLVVAGVVVALIAVVAIAAFFALPGGGDGDGDGDLTAGRRLPGGAPPAGNGGDLEPDEAAQAALLTADDFPGGWTAEAGGSSLEFDLPGQCNALVDDEFAGQLSFEESDRFLGPGDEDIRVDAAVYIDPSRAQNAIDAVNLADERCRDDLEADYERLLREFFEGERDQFSAIIDDKPVPEIDADYLDVRRLTLTSSGGGVSETLVTHIANVRVGRITGTLYYEDTEIDESLRDRYLEIFVERIGETDARLR